MNIPLCFLVFIAVSTSMADSPKVHPKRFGIRVVDESTGRGVPLVELRTVNEIQCITDNAGWVAWEEPGMMNREVFWHISGPGIEREKDGFDYRGFRTITTPGKSVEVKVRGTNIATRIGRLTGQGLFRETELLGLPHPISNISESGVVGQDSVQAVPYRGRLFWLWGDTSVTRYPLGNFFTTCATTSADTDPEKGIVFDYFRNADAPSALRPMLKREGPGVVWMFGLAALKDRDGRERLFSGFSRQRGLVPADERGIAEFDDTAGIFRKVADIPKESEWLMPSGHAVRVLTKDGDHFYFCRPFAHVRVAADTEAFSNPKRYEVLQWRDGHWSWSHDTLPTTQEAESQLIAKGAIRRENARFQVLDATTGKPVQFHTGSIAWNEFRRKFIIIGLQISKTSTPSVLGEVWYAESDSIAGPWSDAIKIASHPNYSFYNPVHHTFFDKDGGKTIYFEGTYTKEFSGNPKGTPRYDYNQIMYRLDLDDARLNPAQK